MAGLGALLLIIIMLQTDSSFQRQIKTENHFPQMCKSSVEASLERALSYWIMKRLMLCVGMVQGMGSL